MSFPTSHTIESSSSYLPQPCHQFTFPEIERATRIFDESLVIGRGGFGKVYRGTITYGDICLDAAIKRLESTSNQGAVEFWAEVEMLSKLRHCHLVSLIGYCNDGQEMILVYEYIPKGTLADQLQKHRAPPTWVRRLKICIGAARSLDYLHTGTGIKHGVIHRDVKSTNILLDNNWAAKVSDFGLSKIGPTNQPSTYVNTLVRGTFGYMDPDYFQTGRLTRKSDVYAFGVVLFEVLCRKQAVDRSIDEEQWGLATWAQDSIKEGMLKQTVDSNLRERISPKCLKEFALLADRCLHNRPKLCPTMAEVVVSLESILALQEKTESTWLPTFVFTSTWEKSAGSTSLKSLDGYLYTVGGEDRIVHRFDFNTIIYATDNFSEANRILPRYGVTMYKGRLQNGQDITITQYSKAFTYKQCMNEASILVKVEHQNLMQLLGYCIHGTKVYLIYDFALNATLADMIYGNFFFSKFVSLSVLNLILSEFHTDKCLIRHLHVFVDPMCNLLDWDKRYKILLGIARALVYLHSMLPFGSYIVRYIPHECHQSLCFSTKADVYSFGMLIFETITGKSIRNLPPPDIDNALRPVEYVSMTRFYDATVVLV
ncbi:putative protein kinase RLK-Pelle-CrRLK1L-1 family [Helianthus annuus]|nr:putative protein kinase RLK-Pelle-CrRLK1L-1 family [Helianthus annuus]